MQNLFYVFTKIFLCENSSNIRLLKDMQKEVDKHYKQFNSFQNN